MINFNLVKVYDWEDIDAEIAKRVGVKDLYGGYYDKETGEEVDALADGEYRNFWHKALDTIVPDNMHNGSTVTMFNIFDWQDDKQYYLDKCGKWTEPYFQAYYDIMNRLDPNDEGVEVKFNW